MDENQKRLKRRSARIAFGNFCGASFYAEITQAALKIQNISMLSITNFHSSTTLDIEFIEVVRVNENLHTNIFKGNTEEEIRKKYNLLWLNIIKQSEKSSQTKIAKTGLQAAEKGSIIDATASQFHSANLEERGANEYDEK